MTVSATNATFNGKQVRTGDCAVAVKLVGAHIMGVEIRASSRTANGAKLVGFIGGAAATTTIVFAAAAIIVSAAHCVIDGWMDVDLQVGRGNVVGVVL